MRRMVMSVLAAVLVGGAVMADPAEGLWQTGPDGETHALVRILPCKDRICGQVEGAIGRQGDVPGWIARRTIFSMRPRGGGTYSGWVWRPANDRIFSGRLTLEDDRLTLHGCVIEGLICSGTPWRRVE